MLPASDIKFKVVTLGEGRVGKTSLILKFVQNEFHEQTKETVAAYYLEKTIPVKNSQDVTLCIWDTAGQEKYNALAPIYYKQTDVAILVYDITIKETLQKVQKWVQEIKDFSQSDNVLLIMVGNKYDKQREAQVTKIGKSKTKNYFQFYGKRLKLQPKHQVPNIFIPQQSPPRAQPKCLNILQNVMLQNYFLQEITQKQRTKSRKRSRMLVGDEIKQQKNKDKSGCC